MSFPALQEPWESIERQREAGLFAMWLFLATEVLFFGGMFGAYSVYRWLYGSGFLAGARETEIVYGSANTAILLTSSFSMALGARFARAGFLRAAKAGFIVTAFLGAVFLVVKGFEYHDDIGKNLVPGAAFPLTQAGAENFWTLYWIMTVIHALHLLIGIGLVLRLVWLSRGSESWLKQSAGAEATALYWHFVDAIWVFLFPLLYLAGRA